MVLGVEIFGLQIENPGPVLFYSCEEDRNDLHWRLDKIVKSFGKSFLDIKDLHMICPKDAALTSVDKNDVVKTTAALGGLEQEIRRIRPRLVWLDPSAKIFDGDENSRKIAEQSSKVMRGLTEICDSTVITLQHPSLAGMQSKRGTSGSTGWHNDVRFRNYISKVQNTDYLKIENMKLNHGKPGTHINVRWDDAAQLFVKCGTVVPPADVPTPMEQKYRALFLKLLDESTDWVSASPSSTHYAPKVFSLKHGTAKHIFERTMDSLLKEGEIREEETGKNSHAKKYLVRGTAPTAAEL